MKLDIILLATCLALNAIWFVYRLFGIVRDKKRVEEYLRRRNELRAAYGKAPKRGGPKEGIVKIGEFQARYDKFGNMIWNNYTDQGEESST